MRRIFYILPYLTRSNQHTRRSYSIFNAQLDSFAPLERTVSTGVEKHGMRVLASDTSFFKGLLSVHMGVESLPSFALRRGPSLGWRLLFNHG